MKFDMRHYQGDREGIDSNKIEKAHGSPGFLG